VTPVTDFDPLERHNRSREVTSMHPTEVLTNEHRVIERRLDEMERQIAAGRSGRGFQRAYFDEALDFFRHFADGCHHAKEENLLFPLLKQCGMPVEGGPIGCMLAEHEEGRAYLRTVRENLDAAELGSADAEEAVYRNAGAYLGMLRQHIQKEDNVLFRMARMILAPDDVAELAREFAAVSVPDRFLAEAAMLQG
jgi:hemerythrin-like domain-containing protein